MEVAGTAPQALPPGVPPDRYFIYCAG
jgi:hypothetical protein